MAIVGSQNLQGIFENMNYLRSGLFLPGSEYYLTQKQDLASAYSLPLTVCFSPVSHPREIYF